MSLNPVEIFVLKLPVIAPYRVKYHSTKAPGTKLDAGWSPHPEVSLSQRKVLSESASLEGNSIFEFIPQKNNFKNDTTSADSDSDSY